MTLFALFVWLLCLASCAVLPFYSWDPLSVPVVLINCFADSSVWLTVLSLTVVKFPFCGVFTLVSSLAVVLCVYYGEVGGGGLRMQCFGVPSWKTTGQSEKQLECTTSPEVWKARVQIMVLLCIFVFILLVYIVFKSICLSWCKSYYRFLLASSSH